MVNIVEVFTCPAPTDFLALSGYSTHGSAQQQVTGHTLFTLKKLKYQGQYTLLGLLIRLIPVKSV